MRSGEESGLVFAKIDSGEDLFDSIKALMREHSIGSAIIVSDIGMLKDVELNFFTGKVYEPKLFKEAMELISLHGSIGEDDTIHIHCSMAGADHILVGGHLTKATVYVLNELVIQKLSTIKITRELNPSSGNKETTVN